MHPLIADLRPAARSLQRTPGFLAFAVLTLSVGIGGSVAIFSLLDAVLLKPLPFPNQGRIVTITARDPDRSGARLPASFLQSLSSRSTTIKAVTTHDAAGGVMPTPAGPVIIRGQQVSPDFLDILGNRPLNGRGFLPQDAEPGSPPVMLVSHRFRRERLSQFPNAVGATVICDGVAYTVVGVMPPDFEDYLSSHTSFWTPHVTAAPSERGHETWALLAPGVSLEQARAEVQSFAPADWRDTNRHAVLTPLQDEVVGDSAHVLQLLFAAMATVLLIACANLAQFLLARSDRRSAEFATRRALGAPTGRLLSLALTESVLLALAGCTGGVAVAYAALPALIAVAPPATPRIAQAAIDSRALAVAVGLGLLTACACGLSPSQRLARTSVMEAIKRTPIHHTPRRNNQTILVAGQVACSVVLFALTGLIGSAFLALLPSTPGFIADSRSVFPILMRPDIYPKQQDRTQRWDALVERAVAIPGIHQVAVAENAPFASDDGFRPLLDLTANRNESFTADRRAVSPNYFDLLGLPLLQGRTFSTADTPAAPGVAIVNQSLSRRLAPGSDVLGRTLQLSGTPLARYEVVGVVADARSSGATPEPWDEVYIPLAQSSAAFAFLIMQSDLDPPALTTALQTALRDTAPNLPQLPWAAASPLPTLIHQSLAGPRFSASLITAFSSMALLLAAGGLFSLVAYAASRRRREIGIRTALGAGRAHIVATIARPALTATALGIALGLLATFLAIQAVQGLFHGVTGVTRAVVAGAAGLMLFVAICAAYGPAHSAAKANPVTVLRQD